MLIIMRHTATETDVKRITERLRGLDIQFEIQNSCVPFVILINDETREVPSLNAFHGVDRIVRTTPRFKLASRAYRNESTVVEVNGCRIGSGNFCVIAGPCSVESMELGEKIASLIKSENLSLMRGGAFKPRTSPYSFQGLEYEGLEILEQIRRRTGILVVTEAIDVNSIEKVESVADMIQVGSRNMQNFSLLKRLGKTHKPILLKRGMSATIEELLLAAEYILAGGNSNVVLCERGIRSFDSATRNTLDLSAIPVVRELSHLPIIVDPSHATGKHNYVQSMSKAAMAAGADGLLLEVHVEPEMSYSDGAQSLNPDEFTKLMIDLNKLADVLKIKIN